MIAQPTGVLGIRVADGRIVEVLDFQNQKANNELFTTVVDRQKRARFDFFYKETSSDQWFFLDNLLVNWIPPAKAGDPDLEVQIACDEQGNLVLGIDGCSSEKTQVFVLDGETLIARCRQLDSVSAAGRGRGYAPRQQSCSSDRERDKERKGGRGWIALVAAVPIFVAAFVIGSKHFSTTPEDVKQRARETVQVVKERVSDRVVSDRAELTEQVDSVDTVPLPEKQYAPPSRLLEPLETSGPGRVEINTQQVSHDAELGGGTVSERTNTTSEEELVQDPDWYRITWGDTLWRIAERFYGDRDLFNELAESNRLNDPDVIIAGEDLQLPPKIGDTQRK